MRQQIDQKSLYYEHQGSNTIYYSYNTAVAVKTPIDTYVCENVWSVTTAKHLNRIEELTGSDREYRMRYQDFREFCINNNINKHYILEANHPSPLSANRGGWFGCKHFSKTNEILKKNDKKEIKW